MDKQFWLNRQTEKIMASHLSNDNKEAILRYIEVQKDKIRWSQLPVIIKIVTSPSFSIDLKTMSKEGMVKTFDILNEIRWFYSPTSFLSVKYYWSEFLEGINSIYNLGLEPKKEIRKFNLSQRRKFVMIQKEMPIEVKT